MAHTEIPLVESFPRSPRYARLREAAVRAVRERMPDARVFPYTERHLQCVWCDAALRPSPLRTHAGETVLVERPGRWNLEAGPDFLGAALTVGPERRRLEGDVEIHVRPADWQTHGHADDPLYARVVAHVSYFPGSLTAGLLPRGAVEIALRDPLAASPAFSFESVDLTAYPYAALPDRPPPCAGVLAQWTPARRADLLEAAGEERLRLKAARLAAAIRANGEEQTFYEEMLCALGYKHNRAPFRQLARRLPYAALAEESADPLAAYGLMLGVAGLMPARVSPRWDDATRGFVRGLWDRWWKQRAQWEGLALPRAAWRLSGLRPQNHPVRRLAAAAMLFTARPPLAARLTALDAGDARRWFHGAGAALGECRGITYWSRRLCFAGPPRPRAEALMGSARIAAMLANVVIPFLAAQGTDVRPLLGHLPPEEDNSLVRQTAHALFGRDHNPSLYASGLRRQGLLQIFHDFCLTRVGCQACRLAEALATFPR